MAANAVASDVELFFDWGPASALGVVLLVLAALLLGVAARLVRLDRVFGGHG
jgi:putative spermidine/putrescine transport system permease protein/spermidine/putrescine transport system permease protein